MLRDTRRFRVTYNPPDDVLRISFRQDCEPTRLLHPLPPISVSLRDQQLVAIELRGASFHVAPDQLGALVVAEEFVTVKEAARIAGKSPAMIRQRIHCAHLRAIKRGRDWFIHRGDLEQFLAGPRYREWDLL